MAIKQINISPNHLFAVPAKHRKGIWHPNSQAVFQGQESPVYCHAGYSNMHINQDPVKGFTMPAALIAPTTYIKMLVHCHKT